MIEHHGQQDWMAEGAHCYQNSLLSIEDKVISNGGVVEEMMEGMNVQEDVWWS